MAKGIKACLFDLGNVLISFDHTIAARRISAHAGESPQEIYRLFFDSEVTRLFEEGKITPEAFFEQVKKMLGLAISFQSFLPIWNEIFFLNEDNRRACKIAEGLSREYKLAVLSNINSLHMGYIRNNFPEISAFKNFFASCEMGMVKPDHKIYKKALEMLDVSPEEAFYTDDRKELIEEASKLGIRAFTYTGPEQLEKDLSACGIKFL